MLLTFGPYFVFYKASRLGATNSYMLCAYAALAYIATQAIKLLFFATFVPSSDGSHFDLIQELLKAVINCGDILGIYLILNWKRVGGSDERVIGVGLGWALAESIFIRLAPLWIGARQTEFDWEYLRTSLQANISLVVLLAFTTLVWTYSSYRRKVRENTKHTNYLLAVLFLYPLFPVISGILSLVVGRNMWYPILFHAAFALTYAAAAKQLQKRYLTR